MQTSYHDGTSEKYGYDGLNRRVVVTNQAGIITRFGFDALSRLTAVTNGFSTGTSNWAAYAYDEVGNQTNQVDALNRKTLFDYDAMARRIKTTLPGNQSEQFAYDAAGNLSRHTTFNGVILTNQYDALNRLTSKSSGGGYSISFTYSATGKRATQSDASGSYVYAYDANDRLTTNSGPAGRLVYSYDLFGRLQAIQSSRSGGASLSYTYDVLNRVSNAVDAVAGTSVYDYDGVGNLYTVRYPNTVTNTFLYDNLNRLTNLTAKTASGSIATFAYKLAQAGNRTNLAETVNGSSRTFAWYYDPLYRLTAENITGVSPTGNTTNKFDTVGNRTNRTTTIAGVSGLTNQAFTFNTNDWLTIDAYDSNGNTRTNAGAAYFYDVENRLTNSPTVTNILYNADGIRVAKTIGATTTLYLVDDRNPSGYAQVLEELTVSSGSTNLAKVYTYGLDLIAQRDTGSATTTFYGYDGNGNTRYLTAANATVSDTYVYDAFGLLLTSSESTANAYRYGGEQLDSDLGLYYLRARYLNIGTGRFWTRDSFAGRKEDAQSLHRYLYAAQNPINNTDPSGHDLLAANRGRKVHEVIGEHFRQAFPGFGISGPSIAKILREEFHLNLDTVIALFPDLVNANPANKEIYEIKPIDSFVLGQVQLEGYLQVFNYFDPAKGWHAGNSYTPPVEVTIDPLTIAIVSPPVRGVILYKIFSVQEFAKKRAINVSASHSAQINDSVNLSTLTALLGGFAF